MKIAAIVVRCLFLRVGGAPAVWFVRQEWQLGSQLADVQANLAKAQTQEASLQNEAQYLSNPANLEKELRARFNYKKPGEQMIIIVPAGPNTTSTD